jgi:hypothetical protein
MASNNKNSVSDTDNSKNQQVNIDSGKLKEKEEIKIKLKNILDNSKINHKKRILESSTLKDAHIYCKINNLSGQITGPLIEKYILTKNNMTKTNASNCTGDAIYNEQNYEIKVSNGGKNNDEFNFVQLRLNHNCNYILSVYYISHDNLDDLGELFIFKLTKEQMKDLILKYGTYAHGTVSKLGKITKEDINNKKNSKEYAIRPKYGDTCWKDLLNYRIDKI